MALNTGEFEDGKSVNGLFLREFAAWSMDSGLGVSSQVISGFKVTAQASPGPTLQVAVGRAGIAATESGKFGVYPVYNDAVLNTTGFAATSGNGRIDRLIVRVTSGVAALEIVQGTASASPAVPAITGDNYIEIGRLTAPASTTNFTNAMLGTDPRVFGGKWAQPWGILPGGSQIGTASVAGATPSNASIISAAVTVGPNRRIRIDYSTMATITSGAVLDLSNWELCRDGTVIMSRQHQVSALTKNETVAFSWVDNAPAAGAHTYLVRWSTNVAAVGFDSASATYPRQLIISDAGAFGNPD